MNEYFIDIIGFEGLYQISNLGRIKSFHRQHVKFLSPGLLKTGYYIVVLCKDSKAKTFTIHRLIAKHFISNPNNKLEVNHINGIKTDNRIENLEWVTHKENSHHAWKMGLKTPAMTGIIDYDNKKSIPIICIDTCEAFASSSHAARMLNLSRPNIIKVLKGERHHVNGLKFKYA